MEDTRAQVHVQNGVGAVWVATCSWEGVGGYAREDEDEGERTGEGALRRRMRRKES